VCIALSFSRWFGIRKAGGCRFREEAFRASVWLGACLLNAHRLLASCIAMTGGLHAFMACACVLHIHRV
jgi:hypothetical protein